MLKTGYEKISPEDTRLFKVTNSLKETVNLIEVSREVRLYRQSESPRLGPRSQTGEGTLAGGPIRTYGMGRVG